MKNISRYFLALGTAAIVSTSCTDLQEINENPNSPAAVPSHMLMSGTEKWIMDNIYDNWFSGRQCLLYAQYWSQRNYTEEDRYQIRESTNNGYFNYLYQGISNLNKVIELNTDPAVATSNSAFGANCNQIAAAKILKCWLMQVITDTWGNVPYSEVGRLEKEGILYCKYEDQKDIYADLIKTLTEAVNSINEDEPAFVAGDVIYGGDASAWKKFGNSLKCRLAIHLSKVDSNWKTYIAEAIASGVFESNDDCAVFKYGPATGTDYCLFYSGFYVSGRNDFTISKQFCDILSGVKDDLNGKSHPWEGTVDPRRAMYTNTNSGAYKGFPYGISSAISAAGRSGTPNWYSGRPCFLEADYQVPLMTYAELLFILSEYNGFSAAEYEEGVRASIEYWSNVSSKTVSEAELEEYIAAVTANVTAEAVALQKYIDLFTNGTEAWTEIRRTGYPEQLVRPGEISGVVNGEEVKFVALSEVKGDIISRVKYPTNESTLNGANWTAAVAKLQDGTNNYYTKMFWDVRTSKYDHPANK